MSAAVRAKRAEIKMQEKAGVIKKDPEAPLKTALYPVSSIKDIAKPFIPVDDPSRPLYQAFGDVAFIATVVNVPKDLRDALDSIKNSLRWPISDDNIQLEAQAVAILNESPDLLKEFVNKVAEAADLLGEDTDNALRAASTLQLTKFTPV